MTYYFEPEDKFTLSCFFITIVFLRIICYNIIKCINSYNVYTKGGKGMWVLSTLIFACLFRSFLGIFPNSNSFFLIFWGVIICMILASIIAEKLYCYMRETYETKTRYFIIVCLLLFVISLYR